MDVELSPEMQSFVEEQVASGRFASADGVIAAALAMLMDFEKERSAFDAELGRRLEGLDRGESLTAEELREHFRKRGDGLALKTTRTQHDLS